MARRRQSERMVILRRSEPSTRGAFRGPRSLPADHKPVAATLSVEVDDIERRRIPILAHDSSLVALAPAIPMKLIVPRSVSDAVPPAAQSTPWGIEAVGAQTSPFSGQGIVVAVLDTGIDATHPAFAGIEIVQKDFTTEGDGDNHGHGTHCAGTIFGRPVGGARIGIATGVKKALIGKVLSAQSGSSDSIVSAIMWAMSNGAHVVSMSLGMDFPGYQLELQQRGLPAAIATSRALEGYRANVQLFERLASFIRSQSAFMQPMIIVAAAGNESDRDTDPNFEIAVSPPAVSEGIISVGAIGRGPRGFTVASFSNTGPSVSGPGVDIISAKPGGGFATMSGTSMATPHVAGVAALWAEKIKGNGLWNAGIMTSRLIASASSAGFVGDLDASDIGAGMVRAPQA